MLTVILRTVVVYSVLILAVRLMGKRQLGELQPSELVTTILISNLASLPIETTDLPIVGALAPIFIIICLEIVLSVLSIKSSKFSKIVAGSSKPVIRDGVIDQNILRELRYSIEDLLEALRNKDIYDVRDVDYAVIETNGQLNVYKTFAKQNPTNESFQFKQDIPSRPPVTVIVDGELKPQALAFCEKDENWLESVLLKKGVRRDEIMLMQCDAGGDVHVVKRQLKKLKGKSQA